MKYSDTVLMTLVIFITLSKFQLPELKEIALARKSLVRKSKGSLVTTPKFLGLSTRH